MAEAGRAPWSPSGLTPSQQGRQSRLQGPMSKKMHLLLRVKLQQLNLTGRCWKDLPYKSALNSEIQTHKLEVDDSQLL